MSNNKQSSVDWLVSQLKISTYWDTLIAQLELMDLEIDDIIEQAKAMHKEEIENAFVECWKANMPDGYECKLSANEYYNETYAGGEQ